VTGSECNQPEWKISNDHTRVGAPASVTRDEVQECLDYCLNDVPDCLGVDVDYERDPIRCWAHTNPDDYVDSNLWGQPGTDSYQLISRCATGTSVAATATCQYTLSVNGPAWVRDSARVWVRDETINDVIT